MQVRPQLEAAVLTWTRQERRIPFSYDDMFASGSPAVSGSRGEALTGGVDRPPR